MKRIFLVAFILIINSAFGGSNLATAQTPATWYVATVTDTPAGSNSHDCSLNAPCATVQYVLDNKVNAGDTIKIKPGTYIWGTSHILINNPSRHTGITITAADINNKPLLSFTAAATPNIKIYSGVSNVTLSYLRVQGGATRLPGNACSIRADESPITMDHLEIFKAASAVCLYVGRQATFTNNLIYEVGTYPLDKYIADAQGGSVGMYYAVPADSPTWTAATSWAEGSYIAYNEVYDNGQDGWIGIGNPGTANIRYVEIAYNNFHDAGEDGIDMKDIQYVKIHHNKFHHNWNKGIGNASYNAWDIEIYDNEIYANDAVGLMITPKANRWSVYNNLIYGNCLDPDRTDGCPAVYINGPNIKFYNNTVINNNNNLAAPYANMGNMGIMATYLATGLEVYNNIFYNNGQNGTLAYGNIKSNAVGTYSNNYVYPPSPGKTGDRAVTSSNPYLMNLSSDPNIKDYRIANSNSPLIDAGTAVDVTTDYIETSRPQGDVYDIGAYEYVSGGDNTPPASPTGLSVQ